MKKARFGSGGLFALHALVTRSFEARLYVFLGCDSRSVFFRFGQVKDEGEAVPTTHLDVFSISYVCTQRLYEDERVRVSPTPEP